MRYLLLLLLMAGCERAPIAQTPAAPAVPVVPAVVVPVSAEPKVAPLVKLPYVDDVRAAGEFYFGVPAPVPAIMAQIQQESGFNPLAKSQAGALGILQFMPATAQWAAQAGGFGIAAPLDPKWSIRAGTWFDRWLYDRVRVADTKCDRWLFALAGYNGGERWTQRRQALSSSPGSWAMTGHINPGITAANQRENFGYGPRILYALQPKYMHLGPLVCKGG